MAKETKLFSAFFLLLLLVMATEIGVRVAEGRACESESHKFKGVCVSDTNCATVCQTEGFPGGECGGFRRRCFCSKPCP
ncbi:hypothetical protein Ancab_002839 [Ancistrocladus abbreviatus]